MNAFTCIDGLCETQNRIHSLETSMAKVSLLMPTRLKATHSTVILWLAIPTVRTLSTSTAPFSSLWTSTVGAWRGIANCNPEVFSLHLSTKETNAYRNRCVERLLLKMGFQGFLRPNCTDVGRIPRHWYQTILGAG